MAVEKRDLLERCILEKALGVKETAATFHVDKGVVEELYTVAERLTEELITTIGVASCDGLLMIPPTPSIVFTLLFLEFLRRRDKDIPVILLDYYNFDPTTPYLTAFITEKNFQGENCASLLRLDPLYPVLRERIAEYADCIVVGEGYDVIQAITDKTPVKGCTFFWNKNKYEPHETMVSIEHQPHTVTVVHSHPVALDTVPFPDYSSMQSIYKFAQVELSRGCPCPCVFCEISAYAPSFRRHSPQYFLDLLEHMRTYTFDSLSFWDTALNTDQPYTIDILEKAKKAGFYDHYFAHLRSIPTDPRLIRLMGETGCDTVAVGMESASQKVLTDMRKPARIPALEALLPLLGETGIKTVLYTMVGFPTETLEDVKKTLSFINKIHSLCDIEVTGSMYWIGLIQRLSYKKFFEYGIQCAPPQKDRLPHSTRIMCSPGLYTILSFTKGMDRSALNKALHLYRDTLQQLGLPPAPFF